MVRNDMWLGFRVDRYIFNVTVNSKMVENVKIFTEYYPSIYNGEKIN